MLPRDDLHSPAPAGLDPGNLEHAVRERLHVVIGMLREFLDVLDVPGRDVPLPQKQIKFFLRTPTDGGRPSTQNRRKRRRFG